MCWKQDKPPCQQFEFEKRIIPPYSGFTDYTPVIPKLYWDVYSAEQRYHAICEELCKVICYCDYMGDITNEYAETVAALIVEFEKFKESGFYDYYAEQIEQWINDHMPDIISKAIKMVFFGLNLDGYFVAYIPDSWADITFDTIADYSSDYYGRLTLSYYVDGEETVINPG